MRWNQIIFTVGLTTLLAGHTLLLESNERVRQESLLPNTVVMNKAAQAVYFYGLPLTLLWLSANRK